MTTSEGFRGFTNDEGMRLARTLIEKWSELILKEIDGDLAKLPELELDDQLALRARWTKYADLIIGSYNSLEKYKTEDGKWDLLFQMFDLGMPAQSLPLDVKQRLDWYKQRAASNFERSIKSDVNVHNITSPIEQIFLMERRLLEVDSQHRVKIRPQHQLKLGGRTHRIDFIVDVPDGRQIAIELDGHDFHERTKKQAAHDRARERTIVRHGFILHRFTGSEVYRNPRKCVQEVIELISQPPR
ncbi:MULTISPECIES: endonuclease domain-containing protein [unclassified Bradyrhizobium]|uniref:endonuclease domain-containing protein n=1 Tax=unclassified Bradyrhizobium TaxID=2631580 RepID=UPI0015CEC696|nr:MULTISPECIES: DUF559 domain-containing protein [unclassified Bradyrhizobium]MBB4261463.1 very-short-patch-repair endonuclease [Bradyrhizobium sp. CIR3A]NYG47713.1 very-short-patch-repair endonuclease [Bradyrhizobium sp. IAR9]